MTNEIRECKHHGMTAFGKQKHRQSFSFYCIACSAIRSKNWRRDNKADAVAYKGGCCTLCGYDKCNTALQFHHLDPSKKDFDKFNRFRLEDSKSELDKCVLLCANCHFEVHAGTTVLE